MWDDDVIDFLLEEENAANYTPEHFHNEVKLNKNLCQIFIQTFKQSKFFKRKFKSQIFLPLGGLAILARFKRTKGVTSFSISMGMLHVAVWI